MVTILSDILKNNSSYIKGIFKLFLLLIISFSTLHQSTNAQGFTFYLSGKVTDKITKEPVNLAEIFVSGSSVGTATNEKGKFRILIPYLPCYLVVSQADHDPFSTYIENFTDSIFIELSPLSINPDDYLQLNKNERKKEVRFFCQQFIGNDTQASFDILNKSVLYFKHDKNYFQATSNIPLVIINKHLGYKIRVLIREFEITKRDEITNDEVSLNSYSGIFERQIMGHYYYEPIEHASKSQQKRYDKNKTDLYYGSIRHFLKALYDGQIMEQGYQLIFYPTEAIKNGVFISNQDYASHTPDRMKECIMDADSIQINYYSDSEGYPVNLTQGIKSFDKETSTIYPNSIPFKIRPNGTMNNFPYLINGPMGESYFINTLPDDYKPKIIKE